MNCSNAIYSENLPALVLPHTNGLGFINRGYEIFIPGNFNNTLVDITKYIRSHILSLSLRVNLVCKVRLTQFIFSTQNLNWTFTFYYPLCSYMINCHVINHKQNYWSLCAKCAKELQDYTLFPFNDLHETCETWSHYKSHLNYMLRWLTDLTMMPPGRLLGEVLRACPTWRRPRGRPRAQWRNCISQLSWKRLGVPQDELEEVTRVREVSASLLRVLPPQTQIWISDRKWIDGCMSGWITGCWGIPMILIICVHETLFLLNKLIFHY